MIFLIVEAQENSAIKSEIVERIINHLKAGKNVILEGPPGVGKTDLAKRTLQKLGKIVIKDEKPIEAVASDIWSRYEIIGGLDGVGEFQKGYITNAASQKKWLLIDEFNRADMNKAFGEMFVAIEYGEISLRADEEIKYKEDKKIFEDF